MDEKRQRRKELLEVQTQNCLTASNISMLIIAISVPDFYVRNGSREKIGAP